MWKPQRFKAFRSAIGRKSPSITPPMHLRYLAVLLCSAVFSIGSAKTLVEGLASGHYRGAKSVQVFFSTSPIQFSLMTAFFGVVCVLFGYLAWATFRDGPVRVEADLAAVKAERIAQRACVRKKAPPSTAGLLLKIVVAAAAIGVGVPFKVGLSALLGKPLADAAFGLWVLVFVVWIGIEGWRRAQRGDEV